MLRRSTALLLAGVLSLPVAGAALPTATAAAAAVAEPPLSSVTMVSDRGDYIGGGVPRTFDNRTGRITVDGGRSAFTVAVDGGPYGEQFALAFAGPDGAPLARGTYLRAQRLPFQSAGRSGLDVGGDGRGCNTLTGQFEIRDIAFDASDVVTRLHLLYEQHCEGGPAALFGEIRLGRAVGSGLVTEPTAVTWPDTYPTARATTVPVAVRAVGAEPVQVSSVRVYGSQAADFTVRGDECTGTVVEPGDLCQVLLRFSPQAAGPRTAKLAVTDAAGRVQRLQLDGAGTTGRTSWAMAGDAGDWISGGRSYSYSAASSVVVAQGSRSRVHADVEGPDGTYWSADFTPAAGDVLAPGTYTGATRFPFNGTGPGLSVSGSGRGCNTLTGSFTVKQAVFNRLDGSLERLLVDFEQHCEGGTPALRGTIAYRAAADVTLPARVSSVVATPVAGGIDLTWTNPSTDWSRTVVRRLYGTVAPGLPTYGTATASTTSGGASVRGLRTGRSYAFSIWTVDPVGNVGRPVVVVAKAG